MTPETYIASRKRLGEKLFAVEQEHQKFQDIAQYQDSKTRHMSLCIDSNVNNKTSVIKLLQVTPGLSDLFRLELDRALAEAAQAIEKLDRDFKAS